MRVFVIDISGKVLFYDQALCNALAYENVSEVFFVATDISKYCSECNSHVISLLSLVPRRYKNSDCLLKRAVKAIEALLNYMYLLHICRRRKPDVVHFQWLPLLEVSSFETVFLRLIRKVLPRTRLVLTIHNIYPHGFCPDEQIKYKKRFIQASSFFDGFICHTDISKREVVGQFGIDENCISVVHHGAFEPDLSGIKCEPDKEKTRLIVYGNQSPYKGTDILIDALSKLSPAYRNRIQLSVVGQIQPQYYVALREKGAGLDINWMPSFVDDRTLNQEIVNADIIVLPYRSITQSGVLLLALYFRKIIVCSDLPSFRETLEGYPSNLFFEAGSIEGLKSVIERILDHQTDNERALEVIDKLREKYSWESAAKKTINVYKTILV